MALFLHFLPSTEQSSVTSICAFGNEKLRLEVSPTLLYATEPVTKATFTLKCLCNPDMLAEAYGHLEPCRTLVLRAKLLGGGCCGSTQKAKHPSTLKASEIAQQLTKGKRDPTEHLPLLVELSERLDELSDKEAYSLCRTLVRLLTRNDIQREFRELTAKLMSFCILGSWLYASTLAQSSDLSEWKNDLNARFGGLIAKFSLKEIETQFHVGRICSVLNTNVSHDSPQFLIIEQLKQSALALNTRKYEQMVAAKSALEAVLATEGNMDLTLRCQEDLLMLSVLLAASASHTRYTLSQFPDSNHWSLTYSAISVLELESNPIALEILQELFMRSSIEGRLVCLPNIITMKHNYEIVQNDIAKSALIEIIKLSKGNAEYAKSASDSISLLVEIGTPIDFEDFSHIKIPNSNISEGYFRSVNFQNADISGSNLTSAIFIDCNFSQANMENVNTGNIFSSVSAEINALRVSTNGKIIIWNEDSEIVIVSTEKYQILKKLKAHNAFVWSLAISPNGETFISSSFDSTVKWWSVRDYSLIGRFSLPEGKLYSVDIDRSNDLAAVTSESGIQICNLKGSLRVLKCPCYSTFLSFSPLSNFLASGHVDNSVLIWDYSKATVLHSLQVKSRITTLAFLNTQIVISSQCQAILWDFKQEKTKISFTSNKISFDCCCFSNDGELFAYRKSGENEVKIWNLTGNELEILSFPFEGDHLVFSADKTELVCSNGLSMTHFELNSPILPIKPDLGEITATAISDEIIAFGYDSEVIQIWNLKSNRKIGDIQQKAKQIWLSKNNSEVFILTPTHHYYSYKLKSLEHESDDLRKIMTFAPGPDSIRAFSEKTELSITNRRGQTEAYPTLEHNLIVALEISENGVMLAASHIRGLVKIWNLTDMKVRDLCHSRKSSPIALSNDGTSIALIGKQDEIQIWSIQASDINQAHKQIQLPIKAKVNIDLKYVKELLIVVQENEMIHIFGREYQEISRVRYPGLFNLAVFGTYLAYGKDVVEVADVRVIAEMGIHGDIVGLKSYTERLSAAWSNPKKPVFWTSQHDYQVKYRDCIEDNKQF